MSGIIIHTTNKKDLSLLQDLAHKMGFKTQIIDNEEEEYAIARAIEENDSSDSLTLEEAREYYLSLNKNSK